MEIDYNGLTIEYTRDPGEPMTRDYPGAEPSIEIDETYVSDWDEFAEQYGATGETPTFGVCLKSVIETILEKEADEINDACEADYQDDEPDYDPPEPDCISDWD